MKLRLALVCMALTLAPLAVFARSTHPLPVAPPAAAKLDPIELSELLFRLLPDTGRPLELPDQDRLPAIPVDKRPSDFVKAEVVRVRVDGVQSVLSRGPPVEPAWTLAEMVGVLSKKHWIAIAPGLPQEYCFGAAYSGCGFTEKQLLASPKIQWRLVCNTRWDLGNYNQVYRVSAKGKRDSLVIFSLSNGSAGQTSGAEIWETTDQAELCNPVNIDVIHD